jgi:hypothetical protein
MDCIWDVLSVIQVLIVKMLQSIKIFLKIYKIFENVSTFCMRIIKLPWCSMVFNSSILVVVRPY